MDVRPSPAGRPASRLRPWALVAAGTTAVAALVGVRGDFPLSDDWSYAFAARELCEHGRVRFLPWTGASLILQAGYGALLCRLFGFSFTVLRLSTLVLAASGVVALALTLRRAGVGGLALALGTLVVALNPLYVNLAFTFMTDVPFVALAVWAGFFYVRGLPAARARDLLAGSLLASGALLVRQHGVFVAAAAALAALAAADGGFGRRLRAAVAAAALPAATFVVYHVWLFAVQGAPAGYESKISEAQGLTVATVANCAFRGLAYLGLFLLPLTLALAPELWRRRRGLITAIGTGLALAAGALYLREGAAMFYLTNVLYDFGVGALALRDTQFLALPPPRWLGPPFALALTAGALLGATLLVGAATAVPRRLREPVPAFLACATALTFAGTLLHARYYFDRYLLAVLPFAAALILVLHRDVRRGAASIGLTALLGWYAVAGTHDYLAWNRARYAALADLVAAGVPREVIDGGMEYNAWHFAAVLGTWPTDAEARPGQPPHVRSWWWVLDDRFVVSFRPLAGYAVRDARRYARWLVPGTGRVLVLERLTAGRAPPDRARPDAAPPRP